MLLINGFGLDRVEAPVEHDGGGGVFERVEVLGVHLVWEHPLVHVRQIRTRHLRSSVQLGAGPFQSAAAPASAYQQGGRSSKVDAVVPHMNVFVCQEMLSNTGG